MEAGPAVDHRERILQVARAHFFRLGFARFTMSDLARELGMSKKTVYQHFRSKEEIIDGLISAKAAEIAAGFDELLAIPDLSFADRAGRLLRHGRSRMGEMSLGFLHDLQRFAPASYARLEEFRGRIAPRMWEQLLREGIRTGAVRADVDPKATANLILVVMHSLLHPDNLDRLQLEPAQVMSGFFRLIFVGILTDAGRLDHESTPNILTP
ncbi:MAG TPA: TetR/AcrR family transcriptional regulator [Opitutaceae bacterium]